MMRTNIVIDDQLMADAMRASGAKTKKEAVEEALRTMIRIRGQEVRDSADSRFDVVFIHHWYSSVLVFREFQFSFHG